MFLHDTLEFAIGQILNAPVDTERQILAGSRATDTFDILDNVMTAVFDDALGAGLSNQPVLVGQLQPFLTKIVNIGEADNLCRHFTSRVITPVLALQINTRQLQCSNLLSQCRINMTLQVNKFPVSTARQHLLHLAGIELQQSSQLGNPLLLTTQLLRINPYRFDLCTDSQRFTVAVLNYPAVRRQCDNTQMARLTLRQQKLFIEHLQANSTPYQRYSSQPHAQKDKRAASPAVCPVAVVIHGFTITMLSAARLTMPS